MKKLLFIFVLSLFVLCEAYADDNTDYLREATGLAGAGLVLL